MQRVKVYCLDEDGKWDDRGTGHVSMDYMEQSEELGLYVIDEDDSETLLVHRISTDDIYRKQEDTIISWRDPERSTELALSFQETAGCSHVWNQIYTMQRNLHFNSLNSDTFQKSLLRELPDVHISNLPSIFKIVTESGTTDQMRLTRLMLKDTDFFGNLMNIFQACECAKNVGGLHMMFNIVRCIISLNSSQILEKITGEELIMNIIGCLEYDPDVHQPQHHRKHLREHVVFKEAIPIKNPLVLSKIHQIYRIAYLKDVVLNRGLDEATAANLQLVINATKASVVTLLKDDSTFFQELFARLRSPSTSTESRSNLVHFLHEFCNLSKSLQMVPQLQLFRELMNEGIFDIIAEVLQSPDKKLVLTGTDILLIFLTLDPNLLRSYVVQPESPLLGLLVKGMMGDFGDEHCQFLEIFRILLDSNALSSGAQVGANVMDIFFEKHLPELVDFITASCPERPGDTSETASRRVGSHCGTKPKVLLDICELLCICVQQDSSRTIFLLKNVTEQVLFLTRRKEKTVVAAAIRFFRILLSVHDDNVQSYVVENNMLKPIIDVLVSGGDRDNLLISAVLELLEHIRKGNKNALLKYVVDTFWDQLAPFEHLLALKTKYEQCLKSWGPKSTTDPVDMKGSERALDEEEDSDVKGNSGEEKTASASDTQKEEAKPHNSNVAAASSSSPSLRSGGLVDYEGDDADVEDCESPPEKRQEASEEKLENESPCGENEQEPCKKKPRLCSTHQGNKNAPEEGGEAKEADIYRSSDDEEKDSELGTADDEKLEGGGALTASGSEMDLWAHMKSSPNKLESR
ncbi:unnamed protein product [Thlaspi arvense]|uniref:Serine/threonine-protein phosphatase 4 regulatory subunit 3-like central domain-containing protein n=1 Tax=Thlaspi arvense TaxID=13288 RepID=A0AAU9RQ78_THLAR|nr:unnamed protein product [Thlaspi arvense]